jgi:hypothetical protein
MNIYTTSVSIYSSGFIGGQELQSSGHMVSVNVEEYLQNLLMKRTIICSEGALRDEVVTRT